MHKKYSIMVVEDETIIRENIVKKIQNANSMFYVKSVCKNGEEAIAVIENSPVDIVITDIKMPIMDGLELIKQLYFSFCSIKVIILSGFNDFDYAKQAIHYRVKNYLLKPLNFNELKSTLDRLLFELEKEEAAREQSLVIPKSITADQLSEMVKNYILSNYIKDITLSIIADKVGYTAEYIGKVFKKHHNQSVLKYITMLRINEAKRLLVSNCGLDIGAVGQAVGYNDPLYFSRVFKNNVGVYPREFIKNGKCGA